MKVKGVFCFVLTLLIVPLLASCDFINQIIGKKGLPVTIEQVLGKGYDITLHYAYSPDIKESVLDLNSLIKDNLVKRDLNLTSGTFESVEGSTIYEYQSHLASKVSVSVEGNYLGLGSFAAEVSKTFSEDKASKEEYAFATSSSRIIKDAYYISEKDPDKLINYVSNQFKEDALKLTPQDLVKKYGTHVMLGGILGARLDYHMSAQKKSLSSQLNIGAYAKAKAEATYKGVSAGGSIETEVDKQYGETYITSNVTTSTKVYGGKPEYAQSVQNENDYNEWIESIEGREIWCDYYPESLIEIYEFIGESFGSDSLNKREEVKKYIINYFKEKKITINNLQSGIYYKAEIFIGTNYGGTVERLSGDGDVHSSSGKSTRYKLEVTHRQISDTSVESIFVYTVYELGGDYTILQVTQKVITYFDLEVLYLLQPTNDMHQDTKPGEIHGDILGYSDDLSQPNRLLKYLRVRVDGKGEDKDIIYAKCDMVIFYKYR